MVTLFILKVNIFIKLLQKYIDANQHFILLQAHTFPKTEVNLFNQAVLNNTLLSISRNYKIKKFGRLIEVKGPSTLASIHSREKKYTKAIFSVNIVQS